MKYALITPARNEEALIEKTLQSMVAQTVPPVRWVIVDDGSEDRTGELADQYAAQYPWIEVVHRPRQLDRSFAGKVRAFNAGLERLTSVDYDVVGNLDGDISLEPDYFEFLMQKFAQDPKLGVAGTPFVEDSGYDSARDSFEGENYVAGGCQLFRAECYREIGGYVANRNGGIDWIAVMSARMKGWRVRSFREKRFHHYRKLGTAQKSVYGALRDYGERAYFLGSSPVWHAFRCVYRMARRPYVLGGLTLFWGYAWAALRRINRPISAELMHFCRQEQNAKLRAIFGSLLRMKKIDSFSVGSQHE